MFASISSILLAIISVWVIYNIIIIFAGVKRSPRKKECDRTENELPSISIIIPTKDEKPVISRCLDSILNTDYPRNKMDIIIIDGMSTDGTREVASEYSTRHPSLIKVLDQNDPKGKPGALNIGLKNSRGEVIAVFDADSVPDKNTLLNAASYFKETSVVAVQGSTSSINEDENMLTKIAAKEENAWFRLLIQGRDNLRLFVPITGSCQFIRRTAIEELGGWDEGCLAEDVDVAAKLLERGYTVKYATDVHSQQETPSSLKGLINQRVRWYRGYMEAFLRYGRLLKKPSVQRLDAEVTLMGPYIITLCFFSYLLCFLSFFSPKTFSPDIYGSTLAIILMVISLISLGITLIFTTRPIRLWNITWIPLILVYWFLENIIATIAFTQILLRTPRIWNKTIKSGKISSN